MIPFTVSATTLAIAGAAPDLQTMSSQEMAELTEKRHDNVKRTMDTLAQQGLIAPPQIERVSNPGAGPRWITVYRIGRRDSYIVVAQLSPEFTARLVDRWQALEEKLSAKAPAVFVLPQTMAQALRLAAEQAEQLEVLALELTQAVATKAEIGSRREATAMATASHARREVSQLRGLLGCNTHHATIKAVEGKLHRAFAWQPLRVWCNEHKVLAKEVPDALYGSVKAWPEAAWQAVYGVSLGAVFAQPALLAA